MAIDRRGVTSTTISTIGYDREAQTLEIEFTKGGIYQYFDVPESEYEALMAASSAGGYLAKNIRPRYRYARV
jgi:hypothetical protein